MVDTKGAVFSLTSWYESGRVGRSEENWWHFCRS